MNRNFYSDIAVYLCFHSPSCFLYSIDMERLLDINRSSSKDNENFLCRISSLILIGFILK